MSVLADRVATGAAWLDERSPNWWRPLVPGTVPFTHRLYGEGNLWLYARHELKVPYLRPSRRVELGFEVDDVVYQYQHYELADEWAKVVGERHSDGGAS